MNRDFDSYNPDAPNSENEHNDTSELVELAVLEQSLAGLPLREPSAALDRRVFASLGAERSDEFNAANDNADSDAFEQNDRHDPFAFPRWIAGAVAVAACAALVTLTILNSPQINPTPGRDAIEFDPVRIEHVYSDVEPEGMVFVDNGMPVQRYRRQTVEHVQLIDDKHNIRIELTVPQEDLIHVPMSYD